MRKMLAVANSVKDFINVDISLATFGVLKQTKKVWVDYDNSGGEMGKDIYNPKVTTEAAETAIDDLRNILE